MKQEDSLSGLVSVNVLHYWGRQTCPHGWV